MDKMKKPGELSRRDFLKDAGLIAGGMVLGSTALGGACAGAETATKTVTNTMTTTQTGAAQIELSLLEPTGASAAEITNLYAPRLDTLDNKVVALMD